MPSGGTTSTGGISSTGGITGTGGASSQGGGGIPGLAPGAVRVCTYTASGDDFTVTVYRDPDRTTYYLVSSLFASPITQPIGVDRADLFTYDITSYRRLSARSLASRLIRFHDGTHDPTGPGSGFDSTCSPEGLQATQRYKDSTLYVELIRADDTTYRVDLTRPWDIGSYELHFYTLADGTTAHIEIGVQSYVVSRNVDGSTNIAFTDLEGRRVSIDIDGYFQLTAIRVSAP